MGMDDGWGMVIHLLSNQGWRDSYLDTDEKLENYEAEVKHLIEVPHQTLGIRPLTKEAMTIQIV